MAAIGGGIESSIMLIWLMALAMLAVAACAPAATPLPTPVPTRISALTKAEAIGLIQQYLQDKTYVISPLSDPNSLLGRPQSCSSIGVSLNAHYEVGGIWTVFHTTDIAYSWQLFERTGAIVAKHRAC